MGWEGDGGGWGVIYLRAAAYRSLPDPWRVSSSKTASLSLFTLDIACTQAWRSDLVTIASRVLQIYNNRVKKLKTVWSFTLPAGVH
jgi:hypothetical protein